MNLNGGYGKRLRVSGTNSKQDLISFTSTSQTACFPPFPRQQKGKERSECLLGGVYKIRSSKASREDFGGGTGGGRCGGKEVKPRTEYPENLSVESCAESDNPL